MLQLRWRARKQHTRPWQFGRLFSANHASSTHYLAMHQKLQADKVKLISILYLTPIHLAEARSSRSAAAEELLAAPHKKEFGVSFLFGGAKKEGGTCAMLIRESHMVEEGGRERAGEGEMERRGLCCTWSASPNDFLLRRYLLPAVRGTQLTVATSVSLLFWVQISLETRWFFCFMAKSSEGCFYVHLTLWMKSRQRNISGVCLNTNASWKAEDGGMERWG